MTMPEDIQPGSPGHAELHQLANASINALVRRIQRLEEALNNRTDRAYTTDQRPAASSVLPGTCVFDLTLQRPVWSDGRHWRDSQSNYR